MKKTFFKKLFTASIAAITALSVFHAPISFADSNDDAAATATGTGETNAKVAINKSLKIAEGITTPTATFKFTFNPKKANLQTTLHIKSLLLQRWIKVIFQSEQFPTQKMMAHLMSRLKKIQVISLMVYPMIMQVNMYIP